MRIPGRKQGWLITLTEEYDTNSHPIKWNHPRNDKGEDVDPFFSNVTSVSSKRHPVIIIIPLTHQLNLSKMVSLKKQDIGTQTVFFTWGWSSICTADCKYLWRLLSHTQNRCLSFPWRSQDCISPWSQKILVKQTKSITTKKGKLKE